VTALTREADTDSTPDLHTDIELCRLTVVAPRTRMDLALPVDATLADVLPTLLRHAGEDPNDPAFLRGGWSLQRVGEPPLDTARRLSAAGIRDGDVLYLRHRDSALPELAFDDVADAMTAATRRDGRDAWTPAPTKLASACVRRRVRGRCRGRARVDRAVVGAAERGAPDRGRPRHRPGRGMCPVVRQPGRRRGRRGHRRVVRFSRWRRADRGSGRLAERWRKRRPGRIHDRARPDRLGDSRRRQGPGRVRLEWSPPRPSVWPPPVRAPSTSATRPGWPAITAVVLLAVTPLLPALAARIARLPMPVLPLSAEDIRHATDVMPGRDVLTRARAADRVFTSLTAASAVTLALCAGWIADDGSWYGTMLAAVVGIALWLRARHFTASPQRGWLLCAGTVCLGLAVHAIAAGHSAAVRVLVPVVLSLGAVVALVWGVRMAGRRLTPYWGRLGDVLEVTVLLSVVPLALGVAGAYTAMQNIFG